MKNFNTQPLVSIIMNCYNGEKFLKKAISSVLDQNYQNWELIFWDNQSKDDSKKILYSFKKDKRIKYYYAKSFSTLYKARNLAIKKAKGKYLCFLDTDDFWKKNFLNTFMRRVKLQDHDVICSKFDIYNQKKKIKKINETKKIPKILSTQFLLNNYVIGIIAIIIKRTIFLKYNFNNKYNIIGDFDLFLRLSKKYKIHHINNSLATYRYHSKSLSLTRIDLYIDEVKNWLLLNKKDSKNIYDFSSIKLNLFKLRVKRFISRLLGV